MELLGVLLAVSAVSILLTVLTTPRSILRGERPFLG
jgi:hypothetical protein